MAGESHGWQATHVGIYFQEWLTLDSVIDLADEKYLRRLATPADFRLGQEIVERGNVEIITSSTFKVVAKAQPAGGQKRTVVLTATSEGLKCKCT